MNGYHKCLYIKIYLIFAFFIALPAFPVLAQTPPSAPDGVKAFGGETDIFIKWFANRESDLAGYRVYRDTNASFTTPVQVGADIDPSVTSFRDPMITAAISSVFYYQVTAFNTSSQESLPSETVSAKSGPGIKLRTAPSYSIISRSDCTVFHVIVELVNIRTGGGDIELTADMLSADPDISFHFQNADPNSAHQTVLTFPTTSGSMTAFAKLTVCSAPNARDGRYDLVVTARGSLHSSDLPQDVPVQARTSFNIEVQTPTNRRSAISLQTRIDEHRKVQYIHFSGNIIPRPITNDIIDVNLEIVTPDARTHGYSLILDRRGRFQKNVPALMAGTWRARASWRGIRSGNQDDLSGAVSDWISVDIPRSDTFLTIDTDIKPGDNGGVISGRLFPFAGFAHYNNQISLSMMFESAASGARIGYTYQTIPLQAAGRYDVRVDLNTAFQNAASLIPRQPGIWYIWTAWLGDRNFNPTRSRILRFPYRMTDFAPGHAIVFTNGDATSSSAEGRQQKRAIHRLGDLVYDTFKQRHFSDQEITYLTTSLTTLQKDGDATVSNLEQAIRTACAQDGPIYLYMNAVTDSEGDYLLSNVSEITANDMNLILKQNACDNPIFLFLDGNFVGKGMPSLSKGSYGVPGSQFFISFAGTGQTYYFYDGKYSLAAYFFTQIREGKSFGEAAVLTFSQRVNLPSYLPKLPSMPIVDLDGNQIPNQREDIQPFLSYYIGYGRNENDFSPIIEDIGGENESSPYSSATNRYSSDPGLKGLSQSLTKENKLHHHINAPRLRNIDESLYHPELRDNEQLVSNLSTRSKGGGGEGIWLFWFDPEFVELLPTIIKPKLLPLLVTPSGDMFELGEIAADVTKPFSFELEIDKSYLSQSGAYTVVCSIVDEKDNLSGHAYYTLVIDNETPKTLMAGWTTEPGAQGKLIFQALIEDANGVDDLSKYYLQGVDMTSQFVTQELTSNIAFLSMSLDVNWHQVPAGYYTVPFKVDDKSGNESLPWPYLNIEGTARLAPDGLENNAFVMELLQQLAMLPKEDDWLNEAWLAQQPASSAPSPYNIAMGGYWQTQLTESGGQIDITAAIQADEGSISSVEIYHNAMPTGILLEEEPSNIFANLQSTTDFQLFGWRTVLPGNPPLQAGSILMELVATDMFGQQTKLWPYIVVE